MVLKKVFILSIFLFSQLNLLAQFGSENDLVDIQVLQSSEQVHENSELKIALKISISDLWHINSNKPNEDFLIVTDIQLQSNIFNFALIDFPEAEDINFSFSDSPVSVYEGEIIIGAVIHVPEGIQVGEYEIPIIFTYQACNDATCMPPNDVEKTITIEVVDKSAPITEINSEIFSELDLSYAEDKIVESNDDSLAQLLESSGLIISLFFVFIGGLALNLTPCVYPLIPITIGYFGGQSEGRTGKLFILGILYVLGMVLTYSVVGVVTALSGAVFGALLQNPVVIIFIAAIFVALALSMFGLYEFKMPDSWVAKAGGARSGGAGAFLMGLTMGIVAAPCIGPFVLGLVTYVAAKGDPYYGFMMFFFLALGLGFPYLLLALFSGKIKNLPRAGFWMEAVKHIFGFILIWIAIYFIGPLLPKEVNYYLLPGVMIISAIYLLFFDKLANDIKGFRIFKIIFSSLVIVVSVWMLWTVEKNSPAWEIFSIESYETSIQQNEKMIIDFYADWCIPCKELDALTFSDEKVIEKSAEFKTFKVDMTKTMSEETTQIREKFKIIGMPTVLIINSKGMEVKRLTGFINADEFLEMISTIK